MNVGLLSLVLTVGQAPAVPPPALPPAPFLFVKVGVPDGSKVTWHPTGKEETTTAGPVGLRPGYTYRFQLTDVPGPTGTVLHPSIEVRGVLVPRPGLEDVSKHPVPIEFTENDIDRVLQGRMITKVYYLEDPEKAVPVAGVAGHALEFPAESVEEAIKDARGRGRPMLIVRLGERPATADELAFENTPGTILFPGARVMPMPAAAPRFPFAGVVIYDPIIGVKGASEECLKDGGDVGPRAAPGPALGGIGGLDPTDTVMQYSTRYGSKVTPSNRVCICVPRFGVLRVETGLGGHQATIPPQAVIVWTPPKTSTFRTMPNQVWGLEQPRGLIGHQRASGIIGETGSAALDLWSGRPAGLSSIKGTAVVAQARGPDEITAFPGCTSLMIQKWIDPPHPERIGQELTVHLKFTNPTTEEMTDVVIADSLTARLEYIVGTAKSSRAATFAAAPNSAGSMVLRWAIDGKLLPGETGVITFKVRIR
ncbi:MAG TPA: hypothetical protein VHR66_01205 [Gemmataceae bacterium]|jgi:hypothetical protein|nr:hypothetical protein [Gemmataceae bacterium]